MVQLIAMHDEGFTVWSVTSRKLATACRQRWTITAQQTFHLPWLIVHEIKQHSEQQAIISQVSFVSRFNVLQFGSVAGWVSWLMQSSFRFQLKLGWPSLCRVRVDYITSEWRRISPWLTVWAWNWVINSTFFLLRASSIFLTVNIYYSFPIVFFCPCLNPSFLLILHIFPYLSFYFHNLS